MTTVTVQNGRKLTFNPIYFASELGNLQFFLRVNISFRLSNQYGDLNKILYIQFLKQLKKRDFSPIKNIIYIIFVKYACSLFKGKKTF